MKRTDITYKSTIFLLSVVKYDIISIRTYDILEANCTPEKIVKTKDAYLHCASLIVLLIALILQFNVQFLLL